jgi:hypothetical protein
VSTSKNPFIKLLSIGCIVLFAMLVFQVGFINLPFEIADDSSNHAEEATSKQGITKLRHLLDTDYNLITSKPLFIEGRKFIEQDAKIDTAQETAPAINNAFKVRLVGVGLMDEEALVLVVDNKGKYHRLHVNDKHEGWRVKSIGQSNVVFSQLGKDKSFDLEKQRPLLNSNNKVQK